MTTPKETRRCPTCDAPTTRARVERDGYLYFYTFDARTALREALREPGEGPWSYNREEHGETRRGWLIVGEIGRDCNDWRQLWLDADTYTEAEAIAVCAALNVLSSPPSPREG